MSRNMEEKESCLASCLVKIGVSAFYGYRRLNLAFPQLNPLLERRIATNAINVHRLRTPDPTTPRHQTLQKSWAEIQVHPMHLLAKCRAAICSRVFQSMTHHSGVGKLGDCRETPSPGRIVNRKNSHAQLALRVGLDERDNVPK